MWESARRIALELLARAAESWKTMRAEIERLWDDINPEDRERLRLSGLAIAAGALAEVLTVTAGLAPAGALILADIVIAAAAWIGGFWIGVLATLVATLVARLAGDGVVASGFALTTVIVLKGCLISAAAAGMAALGRQDADRLAALHDRLRQLESEAAARVQQLNNLETSSARSETMLREEADAARRQLTMLQSVTDPALNSLDASELVACLLDRIRAAVGADGVALKYFGRTLHQIFYAADGIQPLGDGNGGQRQFGDYQSGRTALIQNDAARVQETSVCGWPDTITSLIALPVVHSGRLQLVLEAANHRAHRSTEWEFVLIQVAAERAAGALREDAAVKAAVA